MKARRAREASRSRTAASRKRLGQAEPRLRQLQERYEIVMGAVNESVYDWDISRDRVYFAEGMERRLALPDGLLKDSLKPWHERIHPEDFARYREATIAHLKGATKRFECDYRYRARDGTWRWARTHGLAQRDARGRAVRMVGSTGDITELKQAEEALRKSEDRYALATSAAAEGIYEWDLATGRLFLTERAKALFSFPADELTPGAWNRRIHGEDFAGYRQAIIDHFKGRTPQLEHEYRISDLEGDYRWVLERGIGVRNAEGRVVKMVGALTDITRRKRAELRLQRARDRAEEALEQQTATAEILRVMSSSPADVQPVFEAVLANALRLCEATFAAVFTFDGELVRNVAHLNASPEFARFLRSGGVRPSRETTTRRCALERRTIHTADLMNDPEFSPPEAQRREKVRTSLSVPMFRESTLVGVITLWRAEVKPFTERQIALVETFAAQAAIAIENVRLFNETKEALQQQTAISEILQVISSSPTNVRPVLSAVAERAARLCEAEFVTVFMAEDGVLRAAGYSSAAASNPLPHGNDVLPLDRSYIAGRAAVTGQTVHLEDVVPLLESEFPGARENQEKFGFRAFLAVPLLRDNRAIGVIAASRRVARRFSDKQVALVETFADQAAIAIENVRLFNETREALEQQETIAEVLGVVTQLQTDVQPVFEAIGRNAARLCGALFSCVYRFDGELIHLVATHNLPPAAMQVGRTLYPMRPDRSQLSGRAVLTRSVQRLEDAAQDADYATHVAIAGGWRRLLAVPMLREAEPLGVIAVGWRDPGPIPEPRVELLKTFADQAVIAIEKVRLFNETKEALERQTAIAEVQRVISKLQTDVQPVFDAIAANALKLCDAKFSVIFRFDGELIHLAALHNVSPSGADAIRQAFPTPPGGGGATPRAILTCSIVHIPDVRQDPEYVLQGLAEKADYRSILSVPMLRDDRPVGAITVVRAEPTAFPEKQIALLKTFADQAVIAIENVRLFNETKEALEQQTATAEILRVISSSPTDTRPVFDAIVRSGLKLFSDAAISVALPDGDHVRAAAVAESDPRRAAAWRGRFPFPLTREYMHGVAILDRKVVDLPDVRNAPPEMAAGSRNFLASGYRAITIMPMMHGEEAIGALSVVRLAPGPLSDKQLAVLKTFADQAVIAIENVRLFNETREALDQQKAAGEILRVISSSIADTGPVFDKILESCERLFAGRIVGLNLVGEDGMLHIGAYHGAHREQFERIFPIPVTTASGSGLAIVERRVVHYPDTEYDEEVPERTRQGCKTIGIKSAIFAPILWEGRGLGAIFVGRDHVSSFSEKEIALLRTFADQAAIAIQNARLFREIQQKSAQLEVASRHKSEFLANMSHELRTPLNAIIGFTRIVMRRSQEQLEPKQYENLEKILASGEHLLALINSILDLSKVEAGRVEIHPGEVELAPVLEQCLRTVEPLARVSLVREFDGELPQMCVDEEKLRQIVINLLSNAAKFTAQGTICVKAQAANGSVAIAVSDTGIGIPPDKLELVFEEFEQADASSTRLYGGTGLGLAIARRLARLMGGEITAESVLGRGSTFRLTLPVRYRAPA